MPRRLTRYILRRSVLLVLTVIASVYVTILAVNLGGHVDDIRRGLIADAFRPPVDTPELKAMTPEERVEEFRRQLEAIYDAAGLNEPFLIRSFRHLAPVLTLDLGQSSAQLTGFLGQHGQGTYDNWLIIADRIPATLLLLAPSITLAFFGSLFAGLHLAQARSRSAGRIMALLGAIFSMPAWFYAIFLLAIFGQVLPTHGIFPSPPPDSKLLYALGIGEHLLLPYLAILLSVFFLSTNAWRTHFQIYAEEDYVELAKAKGLPEATVRRRYILRPTLPTVLTNFSLALLAIWSGSLVLEIVFAWPGLGQLYYRAILSFNTELILGITVVYAYLLGITFLVLDILFALVDPRIRLGAQSGSDQDLSSALASNRRRRGRWSIGTTMAAWRTHELPLAGRPPRGWRERARGVARAVRQWAAGFVALLRSLGQQLPRWVGALPSHRWTLTGLLLLALLFGVTLRTTTSISLDEAIRYWQQTPSLELPRNGRPAWFNLFSSIDQPPTLTLDSLDGSAQKQVEAFAGGEEILLSYTLDYQYDGFPQELYVLFDVKAQGRSPHVEMTWLTPDGREIRIGEVAPVDEEIYRFGQDSRLARRLGDVPPEQALFLGPEREGTTAIQGVYQLAISGLYFEEGSDLDARFVAVGQVHGLAGTDNRRRDLMIGLAWGTPTALTFGILGALLTGLGTLLLAAVGAWFGGWIDAAIQRIAEINLVVPALPLLVLVAYYYTLSIWYVLAAAVVLSIFSSSLKSYRAMLLQARNAPYIVAARAYGASDSRIIRTYLVPRILPVLIPQIVILVPTYVFLEAALAFLGRSDPVLPTWGKIIHDAHVNSALSNGHYYWILLPTSLLLLVSLAFALLGADLEQILNPRLREK